MRTIYEEIVKLMIAKIIMFKYATVLTTVLKLFIKCWHFMTLD